VTRPDAPRPTDDPTVRSILDALAFVTAAGHGDVAAATSVFADGDRDLGPAGFGAALAATVQLLIDEAAHDGVDLSAAVRDVALGVQLAHTAEHPPDGR
jgi:hypothetical protein